MKDNCLTEEMRCIALLEEMRCETRRVLRLAALATPVVLALTVLLLWLLG